MPTICELKEQLKSLGVKGYSGKDKAELTAMLGKASAPVPKKKKPTVSPSVAQPAPVKKEEKLRQPTPPPVIPRVIRKSMINKLRIDYDTREYKFGLAHPIEDMVKWFRKVKSQETYWGKNYDTASDFLRELIEWVTKSSQEKALLASDWDKFFVVNRE